MLPTGTRALPDIEAEPDLGRRVKDAGVLLLFLLTQVEHTPSNDQENRDLDLASRIKRHQRLFPDGINDLLYAVQAGEAVARGEPLIDEAKRQAADRLVRAARVVLPHVPEEVATQAREPREARRASTSAPRTATTQAVQATSADGHPAVLYRDLLSFGRLVVFALIAAACVVGLFHLPRLFTSTPADIQAKQERAARTESDNTFRAEIGALIEQATAAENDAKGFVKEVHRYETECSPLLSNELGKGIAANPRAVETLLALLDRSRPSKEDASRLVHRINRDMVLPLREAVRKSPIVKPEPSRAAQIAAASAEAISGIAAYQELRGAFEALVAESRINGTAPAARTLAEAIKEARQRHFLEQQRTIQDAAAKEREVLTARLADAERAKSRAVAEAESQRATAAAAVKQRELERTKVNAETERLRAQSRDPRLLALYSQFLGPGFASFHVDDIRNARGWTRHEIARPLSYLELESGGLLNDWRMFAKFAAKQDLHDNDGFWRFSKNDRVGRWNYPSTEQDVEIVRKRLAAFKQLAPFWIEQGKLRR